MYHFTLPMALMDYVPVLCFGIAAALLQLDLYGKMRKDAFAMFSVGIINIFAAHRRSDQVKYAKSQDLFLTFHTLLGQVYGFGMLKKHRVLSNTVLFAVSQR